MKDWRYVPKAKQEPLDEMTPVTIETAEKEEKPEGFASKNAKTITFVVMLVLFLVFFGPISVFTIYRSLTDIREYKGDVMTEDDLIALGNLGVDFRASYLADYERSESESDGRRTYIIKMEKYILSVVEEEETGEVVVCLLTERDSGDSVDIRSADVEAFLASH
jgi:hypothetical protein